MGRRYEEVQAKVDRELVELKAVLKRLSDRARAHVLRWLLLYYEDEGEMRSPQAGRPRRRIVIDGTEFWIVKVPKKRQR